MCLFSWHFHNILNVCTTSGPEKLHWKPTGYLLLILFGANWIWLNSMPKHRCAWGTCNSDGRYKDRPHMQGVTVVVSRPQAIPDGLSRIGREPGHVYWKGTEVTVWRHREDDTNDNIIAHRLRSEKMRYLINSLTINSNELCIYTKWDVIC